MSPLDQTNIDCPHCGATAQFELTNCPRCGESFYPDDELVDIAHESKSENHISLSALLGGWFFGGGIVLLTHGYMLQLYPQYVTDWGWLILLASQPLGTFVGGYAACGFAKGTSWAQCLAVSAPVLIFAFLLEMNWQPAVIDLGYLTTWILSPVSAMAGAMFYLKLARRPISVTWLLDAEEQLYQDLLGKVRYDRTLANRLIEYERRRRPAAGRLTLIRNAIYRWEQDNR